MALRKVFSGENYETQVCFHFLIDKFYETRESNESNLMILSKLDNLKAKYKGNTYNLISRNCNHFANEFCKEILGRGIPGYINRLACLGCPVKCFLPDEML